MKHKEVVIGLFVCLLLIGSPVLLTIHYAHEIEVGNEYFILSEYFESFDWIYYTPNCTEEQLNEFITGNYSFYDDFSGCYITRSGETASQTINPSCWSYDYENQIYQIHNIVLSNKTTIYMYYDRQEYWNRRRAIEAISNLSGCWKQKVITIPIEYRDDIRFTFVKNNSEIEIPRCPSVWYNSTPANFSNVTVHCDMNIRIGRERIK